MTWTMWAALIVVVGTVWALIKRYETRLVLLTSGLIMTILSLDPMAAFAQFDLLVDGFCRDDELDQM